MHRIAVCLAVLVMLLSAPALARRSFVGDAYWVNSSSGATVGPYDCRCTYFGIDQEVYVQIPLLRMSFYAAVVDRHRRGGNAYWTVRDGGGTTWILVED